MTTDPVQQDTPPEAPEQAANQSDEKRVPVAEARRYRKRAQHAEQSLEALQAELDQAKCTLTEQADEIESMRRASDIDHQLIEAGVIDLEAARTLVAASLDPETDPSEAIDDLIRTRPYLFSQMRKASGVMSPHIDPHESPDEVDRAADSARESGHRNDLLRYLRLKRTRR